MNLPLACQLNTMTLTNLKSEGHGTLGVFLAGLHNMIYTNVAEDSKATLHVDGSVRIPTPLACVSRQIRQVYLVLCHTDTHETVLTCDV
jgi:hypothetical protein